MTRYYSWLLLDARVETDVQGHIEFIGNVCAKAFAWPANPGFHWLTWLLSGRSCDSERLLRAATVVLGGCWGASVYLTVWVGNCLIDWHSTSSVMPSASSGRIGAPAAIGAAVVACFLFPPTVSSLIGSPDNYVGLLPPNVYHNSTLISAMPFSVAAFGLGLRQLRAGMASSLWIDVLLGWVLVGGALCKPSYAFAFVPAYGLLKLLQINRKSYGKTVVSLLIALAPVLLLIIGQAWWLSAHPEVMIYGKAEFALGFPAGWKQFLPELTAWKSFMLAVGSFALPLLAYMLRPVWLQYPAHRLALGCTVLAFIQFMLVYETGERAGHGNFTWQVIAANHLLYWVIAFDILNWQPVTKSERLRQGALIVAVALSAVNGLVYMYTIVTTSTYL